MSKNIKHLNITYNQLLLYGVHIGHSLSNSLLYTAWLVYTYIDKLLIINLYKSILLWKSGLFCIANACKYKSPIWFINLDTSYSVAIKYAAYQAGEVSLTDNWIHGFLSNFLVFATVYKNLRKYSFLSYNGRQKWVISKRQEWFLTRNTWPRLIFVSNVKKSYWPVREALNLGIPCFGVVDTNTFCDFISLPFPGNDDSMNCISFYIE